MVKKSCDLIGSEHILVYNLLYIKLTKKLCTLNWGKNMLLCPKLINILFLAIFTLAISSDQPKAQIASLILLECGWPHQTTPNHNYDLKKFSFPCDNLYQKNLRHWLIPSSAIDDQGILQCDWTEDYFGYLLKLHILSRGKTFSFY